MDFIKILEDGNAEKIKEEIDDEEFKFYDEYCKTKKIKLGFSIPNFDILMKILEYNDSGEPIINETFADETNFKVLTIYDTKKSEIYFARIEEYGARDEDAMMCFLIFTNNIKSDAKNLMKEYQTKSIIKLRDDK